MDKNGIIYIATNLVNSKQYVGQTTRQLNHRKREHNKQNDCVVFGRALKKYNPNNFKWSSFSCPEEDLDWTESFLIKELNTLAPNGYNLDSGGHENKRLHKLTKKKISKNHINISGENNPMFGISRTGDLTLGRKWSKEEKERHRSILKKCFQEHPEKWLRGKKHPWFGKKNKKLSERNKQNTGEKNPMAKSVILISPVGIEYKLPCYVPFCKKHNLNISCVCLVLQGKRKQHKGWTGRYDKTINTFVEE